MYNLDPSADDLKNQLSDMVMRLTSTAEAGDRIQDVNAYLSQALSVPLSDIAIQLRGIVTEKDLEDLKEVLQNELDSTDNLKKWPCKSLWDLEGLQEDGSDVTSRMAKKLVPDCSAPFTTCGVKRDRCEERGDVLCKK